MCEKIQENKATANETEPSDLSLHPPRKVFKNFYSLLAFLFLRCTHLASKTRYHLINKTSLIILKRSKKWSCSMRE